MDSNIKDVPALAIMLDCSETTIYRLVRAGKIPHKRVGKLIRFSNLDIESYFASVQVKRNGDKNEA